MEMCVCGAMNNGARPELRRCPGADRQPVRSVSERAQVHWGMDVQRQLLCRAFRGSAGIFLLYTLEYREFLLSQS